MESDVFHSQAVAVEDNDYLKTTTKTVKTTKTTTKTTKTNTKTISKINVPCSKIDRATSRPTVNNVQQVQQGEVQPLYGNTTHRQDKKTLAKEDSRNNRTKMQPLEDDIEGWLQAHQLMETKKHSC